jgi:hypothetical protein
VVLESELGWKWMVGQEVLKCGSGRERQAASNDGIDWEGVPRKTSQVGNKASVRAGWSGVGGLRRAGQGRAGQGANSVCVRYMCLGGTSNFRKRRDEKRAHSCGVVDGISLVGLARGGGGFEVPVAGDVFPLLSAMAPPKGGRVWGLASGIRLAVVAVGPTLNKNYRVEW